MRIQSIDLFTVPLPFSGGVYRLSQGRTYNSFDAAIVRVTADDGTQGWGESTPFGSTYVAAHSRGVIAGVHELAPVLLGRDPRQVDRIAELMDDTLAGHPHAKAPLDVACWDLFGRAVGLPVCELLGGATGAPLPLISSIHLADPEEMRQRVAEHRARGYRGHSIKIGAAELDGGPSLDAQRIVACLADRLPGEYFLVDANAGLTRESALRLFALLPAGLDFALESPCATWHETLSVRRRSPYPVVLDELANAATDIVHAIAHDAADGINLKVTPAGGLTACRRQRDLCQAAGLTLSVQDTVGSDLSYAAIVHLAATVSARLLRCVLKTSDMVTLNTGRFKTVPAQGGVLPQPLPGLGIEMDLAALGDPIATWA